uniref:Ovule protein n=1 Tax=Heterorhabditis bacteriophora TaxID=37862 RepID=A0A1I7WY89_HETBA
MKTEKPSTQVLNYSKSLYSDQFRGRKRNNEACRKVMPIVHTQRKKRDTIASYADTCEENKKEED